MGKPFSTEIANIPLTLRFAFKEQIDQPLKELVESLNNYPLLVVGSGGSLSAAHFVAQVHEHITGRMARAVSPLEMMLSPVNTRQHAVLLLTASGSNKDILSCFDLAVQREFASIGIVCARINSKLSIKAKAYPAYVHCFEYANPSGKDGFLALNSLLSSCVLIGRGYQAFDIENEIIEELINSEPCFDGNGLDSFFRKETILALGGEWSWPAVVDLESKFSEAALGNVLISDLRNFGHGRHHWFKKKGDESSLLVLDTPVLAKLTDKTLSLLPRTCPRLLLRSRFTGPLATIDLLRQMFYLVQEAGQRALIDPGKPGVPEFGRKIYHIKFTPPSTICSSSNRDAWLKRKSTLVNVTTSSLEGFLDEFLARLVSARFRGIIFDYDGTLCDPPERFMHPKEAVGTALNSLLDIGIVIGIATGRGESVQKGLRQVVDQRHWAKCVVGYYNGSVILPLNTDIHKLDDKCYEGLQHACEAIDSDPFLEGYAVIKKRFKQISIQPKSNLVKDNVLRRVTELLCNFKEAKIVTSDHSIDVLSCDISKRDVIYAVQNMLSNNKSEILVIGDQGQCGGNDFEMLSVPYSLSVDKVSTSFDSCWNLSPAGSRGVNATLALIRSFKAEGDSLRIDANSLEQESVK